MSWGFPEALHALWLVPLAVLLFWIALRSRARALERLGPLLGTRSSQRSLFVHRWQAASWILALTLALVALAQPRWGYRWIDVEQQGLDLVVVMDLSRSMEAEDVTPSRRELAERKLIDLARMSQGERIGLVIFARGALVRMPLTRDMKTLERVVKDTNTEEYLTPGSDIGSALELATKLLDRSTDRQKAILLISDGEDHQGNAIHAAEEAAEEGIRIYSIGLGTPEGAPLADEKGRHRTWRGEIVVSKLNEELLSQIAQIGSGAYVRGSAGAVDLSHILEEEIRPALDPVPGESSRIKTWDERYQWPLGGALLVLLLGPMVRPGPLRLSPTAVAAALTPLFLLSSDFARGQSPEPDWESRVHELSQEQIQSPDDLDLAEQLGEALYHSGDYNQAHRVLSEVSRESTDPVQQGRSGNNAGLAAYRAGQLDQAVQDWSDVLQDDPEHPTAKPNMEAVQREIELRRAEPPPPPEPQQDESSEPQDESQQDESQQDESQQGESQQGEPQQGEPQQGEPQQGEPQQGEPQQGEPQQGEPQEKDSNESPEATDPLPLNEDSDEGLDPSQDPASQAEATMAEDVENEDEESEVSETNASSPSEDPVPGNPGEISKDEARKLLDGVDEGTPRLRGRASSKGGKDW